MIGRVLGEKIFCGLDIGSHAMKVAFVKVKDLKNMELIGAYQNKTHGMKESSVSDLGELSECIHSTIYALTKKIGVKVKEVQLGLGGSFFDFRETNTVMPLIDKGNKVIARRDLKKINKQAQLLGMKIEEEIVHDLPKRYNIDEMQVALNPLGLHGRTLGVQSLLILGHSNRLRNIVKAVQQGGYEVANLFFTSYVAAQHSLSSQDMKGGCILIDIGSDVTSILIFKEGILQFLHKINLGGNTFTRSITNHLNLTFDLAEEIKKSYAVALSSAQYQDEEILVKKESSYMPIKKEVIYNSIEPEIENLVTGIQAAVKSSGCFQQINGGITMIGGGALLPGLIERIAQQTNMEVRLGKIHVNAKKQFGSSALFSPVVGLAQNGYKKTLSYSISPNGHTHWAQFVADKVREMYQEYF